MKFLLLVTLVSGVLASRADGHGGAYRPPGPRPPLPGAVFPAPVRVQPPPTAPGPTTPRPGQPNTPGPTPPGTPGPSTPSTPGPTPPGTPGPSAPGGPTTGSGMVMSEDPARWQTWWEFNKDPYLQLRAAVLASRVATGSDAFFMGGARREDATDTLGPTSAQIRDRILPALRRVMEQSEQRDIVSSCLVAIAKIGTEHAPFDVLAVLRARLTSRDLEIRETAALAMGIARTPAAIPDLCALVGDTPQGRRLCERSEVDRRTRAFAAYGLGLAGSATTGAGARGQVLACLQQTLRDRTLAGRDLRVAAIQAMRLIGLAAGDGYHDVRMRHEAVEALWDYFGQELGPTEEIAQAHVPPAIASLIGRGTDAGGRFTRRLATLLAERGHHAVTYQSAALALGKLCAGPESGDLAARCSAALRRHARDGRDRLARSFCLIALGEIGGDANRAFLLEQLARGQKVMVKPWAALALGLLARRRSGEQDLGPDATILRALHRALLAERSPYARGAMAIALGLSRNLDAAGDMANMLRQKVHQDELAGHLAMGLALMGAQSARPLLREVVRDSVRRPELMRRASRALGKLGDKVAAEILLDVMADEDASLARLASAASGLASIGDRRSVDTLLERLEDRSLPDLGRAFAAVALGGVADKQRLPWATPIAVGTNYHAAPPTLSDGASGVLDIQ